MPSKKITTTDKAKVPSQAPRKIRELPRSQNDILFISKNVSAKWAATPGITLAWITAAEFEAMVLQYEAAVKNRMAVGSSRPLKTSTLRALDAQIDEATRGLKMYIYAHWEKRNNVAIYRGFGMVSEAKMYR